MPSETVWTGTSSTAFATGGNWLGASAPVTGDSATLDGRATQGMVGSDQSTITLAVLTQYSKMSYNIGSSGTMLQISATSVLLGVAAPDGSNSTPGEIALNFGTAQNTTTVFSSAVQGTSGLPPILLKGSHASNKLTVVGGSVGVAAEIPGSTATYATVNIVGRSASVLLTSGCTLTTINQDDGYFLLKAAATTINQKGGTGEVSGSGAITTFNCNGRLNHKGTGTVTTLNVQDNGVADFSDTFDAVTVTNCNVYGSGKIIDPNKRVTWTNGIALLQGARSSQVDIIAPVTLAIT